MSQPRRNLPPPERVAEIAHAIERFAHSDPTDLRFLVDGGELKAGKASDRSELLKVFREGGLQRLTFRDTPFIQRETPNENYVRFEKSILKEFGDSFEGTPFLRDHNTYEIEARGGTVLESKLVTVADGKAFQQLTEAVKPWAIEGLLDGTIDRFSVGWSRCGTAPLCSVHRTAVGDKCWCWRGDMIDGKRVEYLFTAARGTEKSGVNTPAVIGTSVDAIGGLSTVDRRAVICILSGTGASPPTHPEPRTMDPRLLLIFGLSSTTTDVDAVIRAAESQRDALATARGRIAEFETADKARLAAEEIAATTRLSEQKASRAAVVSTTIASLIAAGKLKAGGPVETSLRATAARDGGFELFEAHATELAAGPRVTPLGAPLPAAVPEPKTAPALAGQVDALAEVDQFLAENAQAAKYLKAAGITRDQVAKHGLSAIRKIVERATAA